MAISDPLHEKNEFDRKEENPKMKRLLILTTFLTLTASLVWLARPAKADDSLSSLPFDDIATGYKIAPVPLNLAGRDPFLVGWGSYLVNAVAGCNDCHTNPSYATGGSPYNGQPKQINATAYLGGGMVFGPFTSRNLTPEANGMPAGLTFDMFQEAFTKGTDFDKAHPQMGPLLQVMPWPTYANMNARQIRAIYEYLSAIPPVKVAGVN
jgi:hypothetical protein